MENIYKTRLSRYREACLEVSLLSNRLTYLKGDKRASREQIEKAYTRLKLARSARLKARRDVEAILSRVPEELNMREIMQMRYLDLMRWQDISDCMYIELRWVMRLHKRALNSLLSKGEDNKC